MSRLEATLKDFERSEQAVDAAYKEILSGADNNGSALMGKFNRACDEMVLTAGYARLFGEVSELEKLRMDNTMLRWLLTRERCELGQRLDR